jgi:hypothetical protein
MELFVKRVQFEAVFLLAAWVHQMNIIDTVVS